MRFENKVALVVGASGGIASACCRIIAGEGGRIVGVDRNGDGLQALAEDLRPLGDRFLGITADALSESETRDVVGRVIALHGRIDILINTVGGSGAIPNPDAPLDEMDLADWNRTLALNLQPTFLYCRAVIPHMKQARQGKIVNVSSIAARGRNRNGAYASSKGGIGSLTRKLAWELGPFGIHCNQILPGRTRPAAAQAAAGEPSAAEREFLQTIPLRRLGTPEDQARVACFLASSDADYVTGSSIDVAGGQ